jgi:hypothetical protein
MYKINISIATIPVRFRNGNLYKCIDAFLNQTYNINKIYVNISNNYKRFKNFTNDEINKIKNYSDKIIITYSNFDSPILKYIGALDNIKDDEFIFIGDDDQEYKENLIENMVLSLNINTNYVYQNRYHIVKTGTAGIIHGFVGLILQKKLLNNLKNYYYGQECWIDDQFLSMYFFKENIKILPSIINDFDDIYKFGNREKLGSGGDLFLSKETRDRKTFIKDLEKKFNIFFCNKHDRNGKGEIINVNWNKLKINKIIHFVIIDNPTKENFNNINNLMELYPDFEFNMINKDSYLKYYDNFKIGYCPTNYIDYYSDLLGMKYVKELGGIYINRNYKINKDSFDIYEILLNKKKYHINNKLMYYFNF